MNKMIKYIFSVITISICLLTQVNLTAQTGSFGNTYIQSNSALPVYGELYFGNSDKGQKPGILNTNKGSNPGVVTFFEDASWSNANDFQHINGYVKSYISGAFTFPIGDLGFYRPLVVRGQNQDVTASYFLDNPSKNVVIASALRTSVEAPDFMTSDTEYWQISGDNPVELTLTYDQNSSINDLTDGDLSKLQIMGWNGQSWEVIASELDEYQVDINSYNAELSNTASTIYSGSISTMSPIIPNDYKIVTFGVEGRSSEDVEDLEFNTSIVENEMIELTLFPNPTLNLDQLKIDYKTTNVNDGFRVVVYDGLGQIVFQQEMKQSKDIFKLPFSESTSGTYYLGIITENGSRLFKPVVVLAK